MWVGFQGLGFLGGFGVRVRVRVRVRVWLGGWVGVVKGWGVSGFDLSWTLDPRGTASTHRPGGVGVRSSHILDCG